MNVIYRETGTKIGSERHRDQTMSAAAAAAPLNVDQLILLAQSPDNGTRESAENALLQACDHDSSTVLRSLTQVALAQSDSPEPLTSRQFALLSMRKLVTFYWTPAFESYRNTSAIDDQTKRFIRDALLQLALDDRQDSKISSSAAYCIVQVSAVDFPDQWPELLRALYEGIRTSHSLNAIKLLNELFDDIISEEMFFDEQIGVQTLRIVFQLLTNDTASLDARIAAMGLFNAALSLMATVNSHSANDRRTLVQQCIPQSNETLLNLLSQFEDASNLLHLQLKAKIYENLTLIHTEFPKNFSPSSIKHSMRDQVVKDLSILQNAIYSDALPNQESDDYLQDFNECAIQSLEFLSTLAHSIPIPTEQQDSIFQSLLFLSCLDNPTRESWSNDFNEFISKETGLMASFSIRDQVAEYLTSLSDEILQNTFQDILQSIVTSVNSNNNNNRLIESSLFLLQSILVDDKNEIKLSSPQDIESFISLIFQYQLTQNDNMLSSRTVLVIPKIFDIFMDKLPNVKPLTNEYLLKSINMALQSKDDLIMSSTLISFTYYAYFAELSSVLGQELCSQVQLNMLQMIELVSEDAEEDTNGLLVEVLNHVIGCNTAETDFKIVRSQFTSVLAISSKDPANIQIVVESQECLEKLLQEINTEKYTSFIELCFPSFVNIIRGNEPTAYKYSPLLSLILEFITMFMKKKPSDGPLPAKISQYIFEPLVQILEKSTEDETLQLTTDSLSYLIFNTESQCILPHLETILRILDRLLSINVSDTAAMNVGTLIVTIFNKFSSQISSLIPQILGAAVSRLIQVKNVSTQENLVSLLCFLTCSDPLQTLNFLFELTSIENKDMVQLTFAKWFESFEIIRGERKIKDNVIALSKIFFLCDQRLYNVMVNGDLIPYEGDLIITRSMSKKMPDRYTQINVYTKIVKLFVSELEFRNKQPDVQQLITSDVQKYGEDESDNMDNGNNGDDEGDWEDVDDVLDYEKLKEYIDDDDDDIEYEGGEVLGDESDEITGIADVPQTLVELLVEFFKEATFKNANGFQEIYASLTENERTTLTQCLL